MAHRTTTSHLNEADQVNDGNVESLALTKKCSNGSKLLKEKHNSLLFEQSQNEVSTLLSDFKIDEPTINGIESVCPPNSEGSIGLVPREDNQSDDTKSALSTDEKSIDDSIALNKCFEFFQSNLDELYYPWKRIGNFNGLDEILPRRSNSKLVKAYITELFYNDWYFNTSIIIGTCFFSWILGYCGFSWWSLGFIFFCSGSVYRAEFRRFRRNIKDDLKRVTINENLSERTESSIWLNSLLSKVWVIYMPVFSQQVKDIVNPQLAGVAPGYGIDALSLDNFTLGSKAPTIDGIKSYTKIGKDIIEMDWKFSFTPNDVLNMTPKEAKKKVNPKIALGVTVGKGFISKSLPVLVEDINIAGRVKITVTLGDDFPNIKVVSISLLEPPLIDFALKPVGGDMLGLDIMSFLPGLKSFVKSMINLNIGPMLYAPNKMDINIQELLFSQSQGAIGVVAITVGSAQKLKGFDFIGNTIDPYIQLSTESDITEKETIRTSIKSDTRSPCWNETYYLLVNSLDQKLFLKCFDFNDIRKDTLIGEIEVDMRDLYQQHCFEGLISDIQLAGKSKGILDYDIRWFPVLETKSGINSDSVTRISTSNYSESEIEYNEEDSMSTQIDTGIINFTLHKIKYLNTKLSFTGSLSPSAALFIDNKLVKSYRTLRRMNEPCWEERVEVLIPSRSSSELVLEVYDQRMNGKVLICKWESSIDNVLNLSETDKPFSTGSPQGEIHFSAAWKPIMMDGILGNTNRMKTSFGSIRLHIHNAVVNDKLFGVGDIDPYLIVSMDKHVKYKSNYFPKTLDPIFNSIVYIPVYSKHHIISIDLVDYQKIGEHREIGSCYIPISQLLEINEETGRYMPFDNSKINTKYPLTLKKHFTKSYLNVTVSFIPTIPVYAPHELEEAKALQRKIEENKEKFQKEQDKLRQEMEKHPDDYEVVEIDTGEDEKALTKKETIVLDQLVCYNSGILTVQIVEGSLSKSNSYLEVLCDDFSYPAFISPKFSHGHAFSENIDLFVRDLQNSMIIFRISRRPTPKNISDVISETSFSILELLQKGYYQSTIIDCKDSRFELKLLYSPSFVKLPSTETMLDTGMLHLDIISCSDLLNDNSQGKYDYFAVVNIDNQRVFRTESIKKSSGLVWNASTQIVIASRSRNIVSIKIYGSDKIDSSHLIGETKLPVENLPAYNSQYSTLDLKPQGAIKIKTRFIPEYIRPPLSAEGGLTNMTLKAAGTVASLGLNAAITGIGVATNVAGTGVDVASSVAEVGLGVVGSMANAGIGGFQKGGNFLKGLGSKKSHKGVNIVSISNSPDIINTETNNTAPLNVISNLLDSNSKYAGHFPKGEIPSSSKANINEKLITGGASHERNTSMTNSMVPSIIRNELHKGRINIIKTVQVGRSLQIRLSIAQQDKIKQIYKTDIKKADVYGNCMFDELVEFEALPDSKLILTVLTSHKFRKDTEVGVAQINLSDPYIQCQDDMIVKLNKGQIVCKVEYGKGIPPEYT